MMQLCLTRQGGKLVPETAKKNPVEQRLMVLAEHWMSFLDDSAKRLLIWRSDANALRFFQCFFEVQKHDTDYTVGGLFIVFDVPFENAIQYSRDLKISLAGQYEASREDLIKQGISADWEFLPELLPDSATGFVSALKSFDSKYHEAIGHLIAVLMPAKVSDDDGFIAWIARVLKTNPPEQLRFVVIDSLDEPRFDSLSGSDFEQVKIGSPEIDALLAAQETFAQESVAGSAGVFRNMLIGLMTLVEKGSPGKVKGKARDALAFARKEKWPDQEVVVSMLVAGAMLKEKKYGKALEEYQQARQSAEQATAAGHPSGRQMALQALFGEAGVHLVAGDLEKAAVCYDQAAILAQEIPDFILAIEALRMGIFCFARMDDTESALSRGRDALGLGERLEPEERAMTTLPLAAIDLLRVMEPKRVENMEHVKYYQKTQIDMASKKANERAAELEPSTDPFQFAAVEEELNKETLQAEQTANGRIEEIVSVGDESFRQVFSVAKSLLGDGWPLDTLMAMPEQKSTNGESSP
jgi:tetratricopeptide (TPR) repeat protein